MRDGVVARDAAGLLPATKEAKVSHSANDKWSGKATRLKMLCLLDCPRLPKVPSMCNEHKRCTLA